MAGALQGPHRRRDGSVDIRAGGGEDPAGKGGVVAAAVLGVDHHAQIQELGLPLGEAVVVAHGVEEVLREGEPLLGAVEIQGVVVKVVALGRVGVGDDHGAPGHQLQGLAQLILQGPALRVLVIAVEGQDASAQAVHDVPARRPEDHILGEVGRQGAQLGEHMVEIRQLFSGGQSPEEEQIGRLLKVEPPLGHKAVDQVLDTDAPVDEPALHGDPLAVLDVVALDVADLGDAGHNARAVGVAEAPLNVDMLVMGGIDIVMLLEFPA